MVALEGPFWVLVKGFIGFIGVYRVYRVYRVLVKGFNLSCHNGDLE